MNDYGICNPSPAPDFVKDPDDTIDLPFNWVGFLDGDTIDTSTFLLPDGLTSVSENNTTLTATIFVRGGDAGRMYRVTNRVTTAGGRQKDRTQYVLVEEE